MAHVFMRKGDTRIFSADYLAISEITFIFAAEINIY